MTTLIQISDLHFGREHKEAIALASDKIREINPDGVIVAGDVTQRGKKSEFEAAKNWIDGLNAPSLVVAGNHDTPLLNLYERVFDPFSRFEDDFGHQSQKLQVGNVCVWGLNTSRGWQARRNWAEGVVNMSELSDIIGKAADTDGVINILACHHPFKAAPGSPLHTSTRRGEIASAELARSNISLLLTGHVHQPSLKLWEEPAGRYLAIGSGTLSDRLRNWPPSFSRLTFEDNTVQIDAYALGDGELTIVSQGKYNLMGEKVGELSI